MIIGDYCPALHPVHYIGYEPLLLPLASHRNTGKEHNSTLTFLLHVKGKNSLFYQCGRDSTGGLRLCSIYDCQY